MHPEGSSGCTPRQPTCNTRWSGSVWQEQCGGIEAGRDCTTRRSCGGQRTCSMVRSPFTTSAPCFGGIPPVLLLWLDGAVGLWSRQACEARGGMRHGGAGSSRASTCSAIAPARRILPVVAAPFPDQATRQGAATALRAIWAPDRSRTRQDEHAPGGSGTTGAA